MNLRTFINIRSYCVMLAGENIEMEDFSGLSWGCQIYSCSDDFTGRYLTNPTVPSKYTGAKGGPVRPGEHAIVGANSVILPKVTLGEGAAVGALSMVSRSLEAWGIYSGVPAKHVKDRKRDLLELEQELMRDLGKV